MTVESRDGAAATIHSTATLHEAGGRIGALPSVIKPTEPTFHLDGPAFPVRCPPGDNLWLHRALYAASAGDVLVVDVGGGTEFGYWGEILSVAASACSLAGLVMNGCVRDSDALAVVGFPVFASGLCIRGTTKDPGLTGGFPDRVCIGDVVVARGDRVVGDRDGVVVLPAAVADEIAAKGQDRERHEAAIMDRLRRGERTLDIYRLP